jgi:hypothetical protein
MMCIICTVVCCVYFGALCNTKHCEVIENESGMSYERKWNGIQGRRDENKWNLIIGK